MKKTLAMVMGLLLTAGTLAGCGSGTNSSSSGASSSKADSSSSSKASGETVTLKVWGAQEDQEMLAKMVENFKKANPDKKYDISFGVVSEADAKTEVLKDVSAAADVFAFSSDQLAELQSAGALYRITKNKDAIISANSEESIAAATVDGELYAYPSSADTYFMYYDKSKYTADEVKSLDTMLAKDLGAGVTNFSMDIDNGWYNVGFFFAAGCKLFGNDGKDPTKCDFNSDRGYLAAEYLMNLASNPKFANQDDGQLKTAFQSGTLGATISGTWNASDIKSYLGDNYGAAKLPTIKLSNGEEVQLGSMANFKLYGVNAQTKFPVDAMALAEFLTNKDCQKIRFETRSFAPTNKELAADKATLSSNPAIAAMTEQLQYATLQTSIPQMGNFWSPAEAFGAGLMDKSITKDNLKQKLDDFVNSVLSSLS